MELKGKVSMKKLNGKTQTTQEEKLNNKILFLGAKNKISYAVSDWDKRIYNAKTKVVDCRNMCKN